MTFWTLPTTPVLPLLTSEISRRPDPQGEQLANVTLGTLESSPATDWCVQVGGQYFIPAWNPEAEAQAQAAFRDIPLSEALDQARERVQRSAFRRVAYGVSWHYQRLSARVFDVEGNPLSTKSLGGFASDLSLERHRDIEAKLLAQAHEAAEDWAVLGLN